MESVPFTSILHVSSGAEFISINDSFEVGSGTAPFSVDFTGGTYGGGTWNIGNWKVTITLTCIEKII
jgi:hypothetical protein